MKTRSIGLALVALMALLLIAGPSLASDEIRAQLAPEGIQFEAEGNYRSLSLRVTGEDQVVERTFEAESFAFFSPSEFNLPDGEYNFEMTLNPDDAGLKSRAQAGTALVARREAVINSGWFRLVNGSIVTDDGLVEPPSGGDGGGDSAPRADGLTGVTLADQVILDDLIVNGSICAGQDCVNGESFGFDTLRLKENNLRIKFQDTSTTASFPTNDWQITANDSSNGGKNKYSIDDIDGGRTPFTIEAGARSHSLYVEDGGRIGFGTSTPVVLLHAKNGNTPTLRLEQDGTSGFGAQTWDVAGNEANFFIRDASNGSTLPFRIFPGAPSNAITIEASGDVGVGTTSPDADIHVERSGTDVVSLLLSQTGGVSWSTRVSGSGRYRITDTDGAGTDDGVNEFEILANGDAFLAGSITTGGMTCGSGCDLVFSPDYELESIEDHAASMWKNRHLPEVGPTIENTPVNLTDKTGRMLNELEKAHIYIEQLNTTMQQMQERLELLEAEQVPE